MDIICIKRSDSPNVWCEQPFPWDYEEFPRNNLNIQGYLTDISGCSTFKSDWIGEHTEDENFYSLED